VLLSVGGRCPTSLQQCTSHTWGWAVWTWAWCTSCPSHGLCTATCGTSGNPMAAQPAAAEPVAQQEQWQPPPLRPEQVSDWRGGPGSPVRLPGSGTSWRTVVDASLCFGFGVMASKHSVVPFRGAWFCCCCCSCCSLKCRYFTLVAAAAPQCPCCSLPVLQQWHAVQTAALKSLLTTMSTWQLAYHHQPAAAMVTAST